MKPNKQNFTSPNPDSIVNSSINEPPVAQAGQQGSTNPIVTNVASATMSVSVSPEMTVTNSHDSNANEHEGNNTHNIAFRTSNLSNVTEEIKQATNFHEYAQWSNRDALVVPIGGKQGDIPFMITKIVHKNQKRQKMKQSGYSCSLSFVTVHAVTHH